MFVNEKKIFRNVCYTYMYMCSILVYVKHKNHMRHGYLDRTRYKSEAALSVPPSSFERSPAAHCEIHTTRAGKSNRRD